MLLVYSLDAVTLMLSEHLRNPRKSNQILHNTANSENLQKQPSNHLLHVAAIFRMPLANSES